MAVTLQKSLLADFDAEKGLLHSQEAQAWPGTGDLHCLKHLCTDTLTGTCL